MGKEPRSIQSTCIGRAVRLLTAGFIGLVLPASATVSVQDLRCEYMPEALGIDTTIPRFSWKMADDAQTRGQKQTGYRILVASSLEKIDAGTGDLWDYNGSGDNSVNVEYAGKALTSGQVCHWKVQVKDKDGGPSAWSRPARFSIGPLSTADWHGATPIRCGSAGKSNWVWFRKSFTVDALPKEALMHIGTPSRHLLFVNGKQVGDRYLSNVSRDVVRVLYTSYDIKPFLKTGKNTIGVWVGVNDWRVAGFIGKVDLQSPTGMTQVVTDKTWKAKVSCLIETASPMNTDYTTKSEYNAQQYISGWSTPELDDASWEDAVADGLSYPKLSPDLAPPNRITDTIHPVSVNSNTIDFGTHQVFTGWIEIDLKNGTPGSKVTIRSSARASVDNNAAEFVYTFDNTGKGTFRNWFNYVGINKVVVTGINYSLSLADCRGYRVGNDLIGGGAFNCSKSLLKKEFDLSINTYRNLTVTGMTIDCLQERMGYGGDGHTHLEASLINYEMGSFFTKWIQDWRDVQRSDFSIPNTAPQAEGGGGPAWASYIIAMPWQVYLTYGDTRILRKTYQTMKDWLSYLGKHVDGDGLLDRATFGGGDFAFLGDWGSNSGGTEGISLFNNAIYALRMRQVSKIAQVIGNTAESASYASKANAITNAVNKRFFNAANKTYVDKRLVDMALPLVAGIVPPEHVQAVKDNLAAAIIERKHVDTGMFGSYFLFKSLTEIDRSDLADILASETTAPGWGYRATQGYNNWGGENWDFSRDDMHATWLGISSWFQQGIAGIRVDTASPGFQRFLIKPSAVGGTTSASADVQSMYGTIVSNWTLNGNAMTLKVTIPPNSSALVYYPSANTSGIYEGSTRANAALGVTFQRTEDNNSVFLVQSGSYQFSTAPTGIGGRALVDTRNLRLIVRDNTLNGGWMVRNPFNSPARIEIRNMSGRVVAAGQVNKAQEWIAMGSADAGAAAGVYHVRAVSNGAVLTRTMVIH